MAEECTLTDQQPRRQSPRIPGPFEARLVAEHAIRVSVRDLSTGGCFVETETIIDAGQSAGLQIDLPLAGSITARAEVVYRLGRHGIAMKFIDLDDGSRDRILREIALAPREMSSDE